MKHANEIVKTLFFLPEIYIYIKRVFKKMLTFLWEFLFDIMILKSLAVHSPCQHIIGVFP